MKKLFVIFLVVLVSAGLFAKSKIIPVNSSGFDTGQYEYRRIKSNEIPVNLRTRSEAYFKAGEYGDYFYGTFDTDTPGDMTEILSPPAWNSYCGDFDSVNIDFFFMNDPDGFSLYTVDCATGVQTLVGPTGLSEQFNGMACNKQTGVMYGCTSNNLYTIDLTTGAATLVGALGNGAGLMIVLACDGTDLWGIDMSTDDLWQIDSATGAGTSIGATGFDCGYAQSMTWDPLSGDIYWAAYGGGLDGNLRLVDTATGTTSFIGDFEGGREVTVFAIPGGGAPELSPSFPTGVTVTPNAGGALTADINWTCPTLDVGGSTLTDLDEMRVYRDGVLIYTDTAPVIGDPGNYSDVVLASGNYAYQVAGFNDAGEGLPTNVVSWVGEDVPNVVTDLLLVQTTPGVLSGTLTWVNPTIGLNGGAFNEAILGYHIIRNGVEMFEVTGEVTEYIDLIIPSAGNYCYTVQPYNSIGDGGVETSNVVLIADAGLLIMEGFDDGVIPAGWSVVGLGQGNWSIVATANATGTAPELQFDWFPSFTGESRLVTQQVDTSGMTELVLEFKHFLDDYSLGGYSLGFQSTSDGTTWNDVVVYNPTGDMGPETVTETFTNADVGSSTFQLAVYFNGYTFDLDDWYVDDIMLSGDGTLADPVEVAPIYTELLGNYPNPFNPSTKINFSIKDDSRVSLQIYNMKGQLVKSLLNEVIETGDHTISWNGTDNSNKSVSSGVYFYKMKTPNFTATKKMILMK